MTDLVLTSNSPGEVSSWVRVTAAAVKARRPDLRIVLALVPCPFASGAEARVARTLPYVDKVLSPAQTTAFVAGLPLYHPSQKGMVVFLGGELWHALLLSWRLRYARMAYLSQRTWWSRFFPTLALERAGLASRGRVVGDLMVDGLEGEASPGERPVIGLFPGSRGLHLRLTMPHFLAIAESLAQKRPDVEFVLAVSPFVSDRELARRARGTSSLRLPTSTARLEEGHLITRGGLRIRLARGTPGALMSRMDVALTIPGTNTAELACTGTPFVVGLHEGVPLAGGGLPGLVERMPGVRKLKLSLRHRRLQRQRFVALPNLRAGRAIAPEVLVQGDFGELEERLLELLEPRRHAQVSRELKAAMGPAGAAGRLAELIEEQLA